MTIEPRLDTTPLPLSIALPYIPGEIRGYESFTFRKSSYWLPPFQAVNFAPRAQRPFSATFSDKSLLLPDPISRPYMRLFVLSHFKFYSGSKIRCCRLMRHLIFLILSSLVTTFERFLKANKLLLCVNYISVGTRFELMSLKLTIILQ